MNSFTRRQHQFDITATPTNVDLNIVASKTRALRERKPLPKPKFEPKVILDSDPDFRINLDVCANEMGLRFSKF